MKSDTAPYAFHKFHSLHVQNAIEIQITIYKVVIINNSLQLSAASSSSHIHSQESLFGVAVLGYSDCQ